jgi:hypothetical protein
MATDRIRVGIIGANVRNGWGRDALSFAKTLRATEFHFLTMLQACSQGVDLKADPDFGEGQDSRHCEEQF